LVLGVGIAPHTAGFTCCFACPNASLLVVDIVDDIACVALLCTPRTAGLLYAATCLNAPVD
jgi:hypothetical protein